MNLYERVKTLMWVFSLSRTPWTNRMAALILGCDTSTVARYRIQVIEENCKAISLPSRINELPAQPERLAA